MKSIIKRISVCFMLCVMIFAVCGSINKVSAYELIATVNGKMMKIDAKEATYELRKTIRGKSLKVTGKASKGDFMSIASISSECETLDLSGLEVDVIPHQSFIGNHNLKKIILPKTLKEIEPCCFLSCCFLETVVLPDSLRKIGDGSFQCCIRLNMQVPLNVEVADGKFYGSPGVTIVEVEPHSICGCWTRVWQWLSDFKEKTF